MPCTLEKKRNFFVISYEKREGEMTLIKKAAEFTKKNTVLAVAVLAAALTSFIITPDKEYLGYFDFKTLTCLFCVLAVVCALRNINFFYLLAQNIVNVFKTTRMCVLALVYITFIGSMLIANDMALLTFLPLGYFVLSSANKKEIMAFVFIMQNVAANLGGMLTPFGNPQNLYLYTKYDIPTGEFVSIMALPFVLSIVVITLTCILFIKNEPLSVEKSEIKLPPLRTAVYLMLFALSIVIVFRAIPYQVGLVIIPAVLLFLDKKALRDVDYPLLLTFVAFFIFAGNMSRIPVIKDLFEFLLSKSTLLFSIFSCQIISNVPSAILLSQFTDNYSHLLIGVNIGGVGTLISSLASLITFKEYVKFNPGRQGYYVRCFSAINFVYLFLLTSAMAIAK